MAFPTTEERVAAAEAGLGAKLPAEYRNRLVASNGGELSTAGEEWRVFPVLDPSQQRSPPKSGSDIVAESKKASRLPGFPPGAVPVAGNESGDYLVFLPGQRSGTRNGRLQIWKQEDKSCVATALDYT